MFPFTAFPSVNFGDTTLVAVHGEWLLLAIFFGTALLLGTMWLANREQPKPSARHWAAVEAARRTAPARGRHR